MSMHMFTKDMHLATNAVLSMCMMVASVASTNVEWWQVQDRQAMGLDTLGGEKVTKDVCFKGVTHMHSVPSNKLWS